MQNLLAASNDGPHDPDLSLWPRQWVLVELQIRGVLVDLICGVLMDLHCGYEILVWTYFVSVCFYLHLWIISSCGWMILNLICICGLLVPITISVRLDLNHSSDPSRFSEGDRESHWMGSVRLYLIFVCPSDFGKDSSFSHKRPGLEFLANSYRWGCKLRWCFFLSDDLCGLKGWSVG